VDLVLRVVGWPDDVLDRSPLMVHFDASGGLIGRAESAKLSLRDPKRTVSRFHGHVSYDAGAYFLEDMGSPNPSLVNGRAIPAGQRHQIRPGDQIRIGQYTIAVEFDDPDFPDTQIIDPAPRAGIEAALQADRTQLMAREPPGVPGAGASDQIWQAFLAGAQVEIDVAHRARPEMVRLIGSLLRGLVGGVYRLATQPPPDARASGDARDRAADSAPARSRPGNPLRLASDERRALLALLKPPLAGFTTGLAAIDEVLDELAQERIAARATIAAAERILVRLAPAALQRRVDSDAAAGLLDGWLPMARKARLWEQYLEQLRQITGGGENLDPAALGELLADAWAAEGARLRKPRRKDAPTL
jgi:predicted component of type VI protein secretion system